MPNIKNFKKELNHFKMVIEEHNIIDSFSILINSIEEYLFNIFSKLDQNNASGIAIKFYNFKLFSAESFVKDELLSQIQDKFIKNTIKNSNETAKVETYFQQYLIPESHTLLNTLRKQFTGLRIFPEIDNFIKELEIFRSSLINNINSHSNMKDTINLIRNSNPLVNSYYELKGWFKNHIEKPKPEANELLIILPVDATAENIANLMQNIFFVQEFYNHEFENNDDKILYKIDNISDGSITALVVVTSLGALGTTANGIIKVWQGLVFLKEHLPKFLDPMRRKEMLDLLLKHNLISKAYYEAEIEAIKQKSLPKGKDITITLPNTTLKLTESLSEENIKKIEDLESKNEIGKVIKLLEAFIEQNPDNFSYLKKLILIRNKILPDNDKSNREKLKELINKAKMLSNKDKEIEEIFQKLNNLDEK